MSTQYLKYALGEIVLVVLGILIALQINNWNQQRQENQRTRNLLLSMKQDLKADIQFIDEQIYYNSLMVKNCIQLLNNTMDTTRSSDSLYRMLPLWTISLRTNSQSYDKIKNASITNLLRSPQLDSSITNYYVISTHSAQGFANWEVEQTEKDNDFWFDALNMELPNPFLSENNIPYFQNEAYRKQELIRVIRSIQGRKRIRAAMNRKDAIKSHLENRKKMAGDLTLVIDDFLN